MMKVRIDSQRTRMIDELTQQVLYIFYFIMNFLNKKYTSLHSPTYSNSASRTFLPPGTAARDSPPRLSLGNNNCEHHPSELVRHLCLECVELLCAQCIGEHLEMHRENNNIPKILSIKQVRIEMEEKVERLAAITGKMNAGQIDIESTKRRALERIDDMRRDLVRAVDDWVGIMREHLMTSLGFEEMDQIKNEMEKLNNQVSMLRNALQGGGQASVVKKVFSIDGQKLKQGYSEMNRKLKNIYRKAEFEFSIDWKAVIQTLQKNIVLKNKPDIAELPADEQESRIQSGTGEEEIHPYPNQ